MKSPALLEPAKDPSCGHALDKNHRILVVDDNEAIHADFGKILGRDAADEHFDAAEAEIFGAQASTLPRVNFELDFAFQGQEALERVKAATKAGRRYAVVFMDVRMPPGWDGLETTLKLWEVDPDLQIVLCTAYSDYSWEEMMKMIPYPERLLILKKPFDTIEVLQFGHALTEKWSLLQASRSTTAELERAVDERTYELQGMNALLEAEITRHQVAAQNAALLCLLAAPDAPASGAIGRESRPSGVAIFSSELLLKSLEGDEESLQRLVALFQANAPRLLDEISAAIGRSDAVALGSAAYALAGALGSFGAAHAQKIALRFCALSGADEIAAIAPYFGELTEAVALSRLAVARFGPAPSPDLLSAPLSTSVSETPKP